MTRRATLSFHIGGATPARAAEIVRASRFVLRQHGVRSGIVEIEIVHAREMRKLHARWLDDSSTTDVLTFDLRGPSPARAANSRVDAQIVVCLDVARRQARQRRLTLREELLRYVVHGCLHLVGYDDRRKADAARMTREQERLMTLLAPRARRRGRTPRRVADRRT